MLNIRDLSVNLREDPSKFLVKGINLEIKPEQIVALVGGSGSGKTTTGLAVLKLLSPALTIANGQILFENFDITTASESQMQKIRGKNIGMVFQEPLYAFNPVFKISAQIDEVLQFQTSLNEPQRRDRVLALLSLVGVKDPRRIAESYPHQLSGGLRQRAMIAQAIAAEPKLIIADEPTSNLDVTLQARIIELFRKLRKDLKLSILLISHDLGMVSHLADEVAVMRQGEIIEYGTASQILSHPENPYTQKMVQVF